MNADTLHAGYAHEVLRCWQAEGSVEATQGDGPTCHRLRGIVKKVFESNSHRRLHCEEIECVAKGDKHCVFKVEQTGGE